MRALSGSYVTAEASNPDFALLTAICRWPPSPDRDALVRNAALSVNWDRVSNLINRHRVDGLAAAAFGSAGVVLPSSVAGKLSARALNIARNNLLNAAESIRLHNVLEARGLEPLFLKGPALALLAYGTLALKHTRDIDVIVKPHRARDTIAALRDAGYELVREELCEDDRLTVALDVLYECDLRHQRHGILVELHWRLFDVATLLPALSAVDNVRFVPVGSSSLPTFDDADLFAYLCVHGMRHGWARLKWLADLNALIATRGSAEIERLLDKAVDAGGGRSAAVALLLCHDLLGLPLRAVFVSRIRSDRWTRWLYALALDIMAGGNDIHLDDRPVAKIRLEAAQLLLGVGWPHIGSVIARQWSGAHERLTLPLPRRLHFLYAFIRPPLYLARRMKSFISIIRNALSMGRR